MNLFKTYIAYVKDNPKGYWFKRKCYGWGWTPVKWQGWLVVIGLIVLLFLNSLVLVMNPQPSDAEVTLFLVRMALFVLATILICYRTGEKPKWQWGIPKKDEKDGNMS